MRNALLLATVVGLALPGDARPGELARTVSAAPGGTLRIELARGTVTITSHDADTVRIEAESSGWPWDAEFDLEEGRNEVRLRDRTAAADGTLARLVALASWPFHLHPRIAVRAWVPASYGVDVSTRGGAIDVSDLRGRVVVGTRGGSVNVHRVAGDVHAKTAGGSVRVTEVAGALHAETRGGGIAIDRVTGPIHAETRGGPIDVRDAGAPVVARTRGGGVDVSFTGAPAGELETGGGSISVRFPRGAGLDLDAEARGGDVRVARELAVDGSADANRVVGRVNGGGERLRLRTGGGSIDVGAAL